MSSNCKSGVTGMLFDKARVRLLAFVALIFGALLSGCKSPTSDGVVVVHVGGSIAASHRLRVIASSPKASGSGQPRTYTTLFPLTATGSPITFPTTLSLRFPPTAPREISVTVEALGRDEQTLLATITSEEFSVPSGSEQHLYLCFDNCDWPDPSDGSVQFIDAAPDASNDASVDAGGPDAIGAGDASQSDGAADARIDAASDGGPQDATVDVSFSDVSTDANPTDGAPADAAIDAATTDAAIDAAPRDAAIDAALPDAAAPDAAIDAAIDAATPDAAIDARPIDAATCTPGSTTTRTISTTASYQDTHALAVDSMGRVHIAYYDSSSFSEQYARIDTPPSGALARTTVIADCSTFPTKCGSESAIEISANDSVHIVTFRPSDDAAWHSKRALSSAGAFTVNKIMSSSGPGYTPAAFTVEPNNTLHIIGYSSLDLSHLWGTSPSALMFGTVTGEAAGGVGAFSLARDHLNGLHLSWTRIHQNNPGGFNEWVQTYSFSSNGQHFSLPLDASGDAFDEIQSAIGVDSQRGVHIAYGGDAYDEVRYAYLAPSAPRFVTSVVDSTFGSGFRPQIAIGPDDSIHITSYNRVSKTIRYAYKGPGQSTFTTQQIASAGTRSSITSQLSPIKVNAAGIHILHITNVGLQYDLMCPP